MAFDAANEDEASARLADGTIGRNLIVFQNEGRPLWDGVSEVQLRKQNRRKLKFGANRSGLVMTRAVKQSEIRRAALQAVHNAFRENGIRTVPKPDIRPKGMAIAR